jgi:hypothetical protein
MSSNESNEANAGAGAMFGLMRQPLRASTLPPSSRTNSAVSQSEEVTFCEFRRKVRKKEVISGSLERLAKDLKFSGNISVVIKNGTVVKCGYQESYNPFDEQ